MSGAVAVTSRTFTLPTVALGATAWFRGGLQMMDLFYVVLTTTLFVISVWMIRAFTRV